MEPFVHQPDPADARNAHVHQHQHPNAPLYPVHNPQPAIPQTESLVGESVLHKRIGDLEGRLRESEHLAMFKHMIDTKMATMVPPRLSRQTPHHGADIYPITEEDADFLFEEARFLPARHMELLKKSLLERLQEVRREMHCYTAVLEQELRAQQEFRPITQDEIDLRKEHIANKFAAARQDIFRKYQSYLKNLKTIDSSNKPRRNSLSTHANNVLRLWLFSNFLNPYPTEEEKKSLCQETGLTLTQINNWFINARVRLWKPTIDALHTRPPMAPGTISHMLGQSNQHESVNAAAPQPHRNPQHTGEDATWFMNTPAVFDLFGEQPHAS